MRWVLGISFALIAALTAIAVVRVLSARSEEAFRASAEEFAVGTSVAAAERLNRARNPTELSLQAAEIARRRGLSLFLFDRNGELVLAESPTSLTFEQVPGGRAALASALDRRRYIGGSDDGTVAVVGLQMRGPGVDALVAYSLRPELREQLGIVRDEVGEAALWATLLGAAAGLIVAALFARRITRIARTARAIEAGDFSAALVDRVPDEIGSLATSIDRMRLRLAELIETLEEDRDRFQQVLERLNEGVLLLDRELTIVFANARAAQVVPPERDSTGLSLAEAWPDPRVVQLARDLFSSSVPPAPLHLPVGERMLLVSGIPSAVGENAVLVVADTTERERSERAQRAFVTNAAHELRTPLSGIVTAVEMLQTGAKEDPAARDEFLTLIEREASRLTRLTRALLVLARAEAHQEQPPVSDVPLAPLLKRALENVARDDVAVKVECSDELTVRTDPDLLEQALSSLVANAEKYTTEGHIAVRCRPVDGRLRIEVEDTGPGIPDAERERVLERFYRAENDSGNGFGLGLAIAAQATEALGGTISIRSAVGSGTTVALSLPAAGVGG
jgi:two-component system, OmpR family, phosphate regulon sensor histidine kinase PhoR